MKRFTDKVMKKLVTLNSYEASASHYAKNTMDLHPKEEARKFIDRLPTHAKIIDIGCGPGRDAKVFSSFGFEVVGIDFSSKMIELAKQNATDCSFHVILKHLLSLRNLFMEVGLVALYCTFQNKMSLLFLVRFTQF